MKFRIHPLVIILGLALGLRLLTGIYLGFNAPPDYNAYSDDVVEFEQLAWSVAQNQGYAYDGRLTAFRAPGYPFLLSVVYKIFGHHFWLNKVMQITLNLLTCFMIFLLARTLGFNRREALFPPLIFALLLSQAYSTGHFMSENPATFFNTLTTLLITKGLLEKRKDKSFYYVLAAGLVCGYSTLVRPASMFFPIMLGAIVFLYLISKKKLFDVRYSFGYFFKILILGIGMLIVILPWSFRNKQVFGHFALVTTNGGTTLWGANNHIVAEPGPRWGSWILTDRIDLEFVKETKSLNNEALADQKEKSMGIKFLKENPEKIPMLLLGKIIRFLNPIPQSANKKYVAIMGLSQAIFLMLIIVGLVSAIKTKIHNEAFLALWAQLGVLVMTTLIFYAYERFRFPYEPFLVIYAGIGLHRILKKGGCPHERA